MKTKLIIVAILFLLSNAIFAQNYKFGKVSKEEILQKAHPIEPNADAAILYREVKTEFHYTQDDGFYMVTDYYERVKIYNTKGFDWASFTIDLHKNDKEDKLLNLKAYTYYLDGNDKIEEVKLRKDGIFEEETSKYRTQTKFTMPDLKEGCVIEYKYTINSPFIFNIEEFKFQETIPVDNVNVHFRTPEYFVYKTHQRGWIPYQVNSESRERTMSYRETTQDLKAFSGAGIPETKTRELKFKEDFYTVELKDVPAMKEEAYAGNINNYATSLQFELSYIDFPGSTIKTYATTWEDVSKSIYKESVFGNELDKKNYFDDDLTALIDGVSNPEEKMNRIFEYVKNKISWNNFNGYFTNEGVKDTYKKGSGNVADINLILVAMLRNAGLNANPVLVSTKPHGIPLYPTRNGFNYVIAAVENDGKVTLMDATDKNAEVGVLQPKILNWQGRLIRENGSSDWVPLAPSSHAVRSSMANVEFDNFNLKGTVQNRFTGNYALNYRSTFKNIQADDQRKKLEKDLKQTELSNVAFENLNKLGEPVALNYDFKTLDAVEDVGGKLYFSPLVFLMMDENPFKIDERNYPIDYSYPMKNRYIVNINIPEGYKVESMPESSGFSLGENLGSYKYLISQLGNKLQLSVEFSINQASIAAAEYPNLKKFYELLIAKEKEKVVLSKV